MFIALCLFTVYVQAFSLVFFIQQYCIAEDSKEMHPPLSHFYLRLNKPISFSFCLYIICSILEGFLWACSGMLMFVSYWDPQTGHGTPNMVSPQMWFHSKYSFTSC